MVVNFSHNINKLPRGVREASRNARAETGRRASAEQYDITAAPPQRSTVSGPRRRSTVSGPPPQTVRVSAGDLRKVEKRLRRDGWTVESSPKTPRPWWRW